MNQRRAYNIINWHLNETTKIVLDEREPSFSPLESMSDLHTLLHTC